MSTSVSEPWLQTNFGNRFDFLDPKPEQIEIEDIAMAMARIPRFGAKMKKAEYVYSVAQHSILVSLLCPSHLRLAALLHDAAEGLLGFDMPTPVKACLPEFRAIEERIDRAVFARFGVPWEQMAQIKLYDLQALQIEKAFLMDEEPHDWGIDWPLSNQDVLIWSSWFDGSSPWEADAARFLCAFHAARSESIRPPRYRRPEGVAGICGWTWDEVKGDFWKAGRLGEGVEWFGFRQRFPHVPVVAFGV